MSSQSGRVSSSQRQPVFFRVVRRARVSFSFLSAFSRILCLLSRWERILARFFCVNRVLFSPFDHFWSLRLRKSSVPFRGGRELSPFFFASDALFRVRVFRFVLFFGVFRRFSVSFRGRREFSFSIRAFFVEPSELRVWVVRNNLWPFLECLAQGALFLG